MKIISYVGLIGCVFMLYGCTLHKQIPDEKVAKEELSEVMPAEVDEEINSNLGDKKILINVDNKTIEIPDDLIIGMEKIYWLKNENITLTQEELSKILMYLNKSNIVGLDVNHEEVIEKQKDGLREDYPILINNEVNVDIKISSLIERNDSFYVKMEIYGPKDEMKIIYQSDIPENESDPDKVYVICYLESKELYHAIKKLWEDRIYLNKIGEVTGGEILLNEKASIKGNIDKLLTKEEAERLVSDLYENARFAIDTHPFGITIRINTKEGEEVDIYYAEDGCGLFQLDGQNYVIKSDTQTIQELENFIVKLHEKNPIHDAIISQEEINADDMHIDEQILGIFSEGKQILAKEDSFYYWYAQDGESFIQSNKISAICDEGDFLILTNDNDKYSEKVVHLPTSKTIHFPRLINVTGNRAMIQTSSDDHSKHYNFIVDLLSGSAVEVTHIDKLNIDERKLNRWETLIALPNDMTLCHYFMLKETADNSYSLWLIVDKDGNEIKRFSTRYFDDIDNVCVNRNGEYICFTYGQTTSRPNILNIQEESVHPIFNESDFFGFEAVTFMNWVNEDTLAIGYKKNGEQIVKFQKVLNTVDEDETKLETILTDKYTILLQGEARPVNDEISIESAVEIGVKEFEEQYGKSVQGCTINMLFLDGILTKTGSWSGKINISDTEQYEFLINGKDGELIYFKFISK